MSDPLSNESLLALTEDLEAYCAVFLKVKDKKGDLVPFVWNRAQHHIHAALEKQRKEKGYVRALLLKGRQQGGCLDPETMILTGDLKWIRIGSVQVGQELVATDENPVMGLGKGFGGRKMRTATVEKVWETQKETFEITFSDGRKVRCSADHRWLSKKSQTQSIWRSLGGSEGAGLDGRGNLKVGDFVRSIVDPWGDPGLDDAWFGGVVDGEGSLDFTRRTGVDLAVSQRAGKVLDKMTSHCVNSGYKFCIVADDGPRKTKYGQLPVYAISISNQPDVMRLVGISRPLRFVDSRFWEGKRIPDGGWRQIVSIESVGVMDLVDIQTSTGTFLAEGFVSHNSTYIGARFYHRTTTSIGRSAFIVAHEDKATTNLFEMVKRYHAHNVLAPSVRNSNAKELIFGGIDAGYKLATAGSDDVGRSNTAQLLHGSEFAYWQNAAMHLAGIGNTIAMAEGTEIVYESTANGIGNQFHSMWQTAEAGKGDYIAVFVPWFWQAEYEKDPPKDWELSADDVAYQDAYKLNIRQMAFRHAKLTEYGAGNEWLFDQEYPSSPSLAFRSATANPLISPSLVMAAANNIEFRERQGPLLIGCDPAGEGDDRTAIVFRQGRTVFRVEYHNKLDTMQVAGKLATYWQEHHPDAIFVDKLGLGAGVYDRLMELQIPVIGVGAGSKATNSERYENKRAEMWWLMADWFADQPVRIPNDMGLIADLSTFQPETSSNGRRQLESKTKLKRRGIRSPDGGDALALTFAEPIATGHSTRMGRSNYQSPTSAGY